MDIFLGMYVEGLIATTGNCLLTGRVVFSYMLLKICSERHKHVAFYCGLSRRRRLCEEKTTLDTVCRFDYDRRTLHWNVGGQLGVGCGRRCCVNVNWEIRYIGRTVIGHLLACCLQCQHRWCRIALQLCALVAFRRSCSAAVAQVPCPA